MLRSCIPRADLSARIPEDESLPSSRPSPANDLSTSHRSPVTLPSFPVSTSTRDRSFLPSFCKNPRPPSQFHPPPLLLPTTGTCREPFEDPPTTVIGLRSSGPRDLPLDRTVPIS